MNCLDTNIRILHRRHRHFRKNQKSGSESCICTMSLRADRCISVNSLEARVPFGDLDFVRYVMAIDPGKKQNVYQKGKYLLRHAFETGDYLPEHILWRERQHFRMRWDILW